MSELHRERLPLAITSESKLVWNDGVGQYESECETETGRESDNVINEIICT